MPFYITCVCGQTNTAADQASGQVIRCSRCDAELEVPTVDAPQPPPVAPAADAKRVHDTSPVPVIEIAQDATLRRRRANDSQLQSVFLLIAAIAVLAFLNVVPVVFAGLQTPDDPAATWLDGWLLAPWACVVLLVAILHLAYLLFLLQVPDIAALRVVAVFLLCVTTCYAMALGIRMLASEGNRVIGFLALDANRFSSGQEALWCFLMTLLTGVTAYFAGRAALRWHG